MDVDVWVWGLARSFAWHKQKMIGLNWKQKKSKVVERKNKISGPTGKEGSLGQNWIPKRPGGPGCPSPLIAIDSSRPSIDRPREIFVLEAFDWCRELVNVRYQQCRQPYSLLLIIHSLCECTAVCACVCMVWLPLVKHTWVVLTTHVHFGVFFFFCTLKCAEHHFHIVHTGHMHVKKKNASKKKC
jgi:hypothetical protein